MPELPEVETMRRGIAPTIGSRVAEVPAVRCLKRPIAIQPRLDVFRRRVVGRTIIDVSRIGKRVVVQLDNDERIVFEPRMTGLVLLVDPPTREHVRFRALLEGGQARELLYWDRRGLGNVRLVVPQEFEQLAFGERLGPDALALTPALLRERLGASRRAIKVALLDQRAVAGIGNLYAAEILHVAGIHPARRCHRLSRADWEKLHAATEAVLLAAIAQEGSTLSDGTYRNALNQAGTYQNAHRVYDREGERCPTCDAAVVRRVVQAQRSTFFCPQCQPRSGTLRCARS